MKILFIGDIVGRPGRNTVKALLPELKKEYNIDFVIVNGENLAAGSGITFEKYQEVMAAGVDYITGGNHIWNNKDIIEHLDDPHTKILRPLNYPDDSPGRGSVSLGDIAIINLQGRVFMPENLADPFRKVADELSKYSGKAIIVDMHAEATSEKIALGHFLDGKVSAVIGTHTHVQTADEQILPKGTAYISDAGMTGPKDSVLGVKKDIIIEKFLTQLPQSHKVASGETIFNGVIIEINIETKKAKKIERINRTAAA